MAFPCDVHLGAKPLLGPAQPWSCLEGPKVPKEQRHREPGRFALHPPRWSRSASNRANDGAVYKHFRASDKPQIECPVGVDANLTPGPRNA